MIMACDEQGTLSPQLLCGSLKCRRKCVLLLFSRKTLSLRARGGGEYM